MADPQEERWTLTSGKFAAGARVIEGRDLKPGERVSVVREDRLREALDALAVLAQRHHDTITGSRKHDPDNIADFRECPCKTCRAATEVGA